MRAYVRAQACVCARVRVGARAQPVVCNFACAKLSARLCTAERSYTVCVREASVCAQRVLFVLTDCGPRLDSHWRPRHCLVLVWAAHPLSVAARCSVRLLSLHGRPQTRGSLHTRATLTVRGRLALGLWAWTLCFSATRSTRSLPPPQLDIDVLIGILLMPFMSTMKYLANKFDNVNLDPSTWMTKIGNAYNDLCRNNPGGFVLFDFSVFAVGVLLCAARTPVIHSRTRTLPSYMPPRALPLFLAPRALVRHARTHIHYAPDAEHTTPPHTQHSAFFSTREYRMMNPARDQTVAPTRATHGSVQMNPARDQTVAPTRATHYMAPHPLASVRLARYMRRLSCRGTIHLLASPPHPRHRLRIAISYRHRTAASYSKRTSQNGGESATCVPVRRRPPTCLRGVSV